MRTKNITKSLPVIFTKEELLQLAKTSMEKTLLISDIEDQKAKLNGLYDDVVSISKKMKQGYEERPVVCEIKYNTPHNGKKTTVRTDTDEAVIIENMSVEDYQEELELVEGENKEKVKQLTSGYELREDKKEE